MVLEVAGKETIDNEIELLQQLFVSRQYNITRMIYLLYLIMVKVKGKNYYALNIISLDSCRVTSVKVHVG